MEARREGKKKKRTAHQRADADAGRDRRHRPRAHVARDAAAGGQRAEHEANGVERRLRGGPSAARSAGGGAAAADHEGSSTSVLERWRRRRMQATRRRWSAQVWWASENTARGAVGRPTLRARGPGRDSAPRFRPARRYVSAARPANSPPAVPQHSRSTCSSAADQPVFAPQQQRRRLRQRLSRVRRAAPHPACSAMAPRSRKGQGSSAAAAPSAPAPAAPAPPAAKNARAPAPAAGAAGAGSAQDIVRSAWARYAATTAARTQLLDAFLAFLVGVGALQFVYVVLVGNYVSAAAAGWWWQRGRRLEREGEQCRERRGVRSREHG